MVVFGLRRATNLVWQEVDVDKASRAQMNKQKPCLLWFTGFSGAGKSTIANLVEKRLHAMGQRTYLLDGDNVRHGLNKDLGFTDADRVENIRRVAEVGRLMVDAGLIVMASFISPFRSERDLARELFDQGEFVEVFVDASIEACERRDPKGLYQRARDGKIPNFTGIDSPYEPPEHAEIHLQTEQLSPEESRRIGRRSIAEARSDPLIDLVGDAGLQSFYPVSPRPITPLLGRSTASLLETDGAQAGQGPIAHLMALAQAGQSPVAHHEEARPRGGRRDPSSCLL